MESKLIGKVLLNQYRVDSFIAAGGMGTVFRVWDLKRSVPLAMKVLNMDLAEDPALLRRFRREAKFLQDLTHPNIVPFYGLHQAGDLFFIVVHYIDGPTLKDLISNREGEPFQIYTAMAFLKALTAALGYAHGSGVVHCDVKPGNVMVGKGGEIYLTDFGISHQVEGTTMTLAGTGTPAYMAPEQIRAEPAIPQTDVYALGVLFYELLAGRRPFTGDERTLKKTGTTLGERLRTAHLTLTPRDPRSYNPSISPQMAGVVLRALSKEPSERFPSMQAFFDAACTAAGIPIQEIPDRVTSLSPAAPSSEIPSEPPVSAQSTVIEPVKEVGWQNRWKGRGARLPLIGGAGLLGIIALIILLRDLSPTKPTAFTTMLTSAPLTATHQALNISSGVVRTTKVQPTRTPTRIRPTRTVLPSSTITPIWMPTRPTYYPLNKCAPSRVEAGDVVQLAPATPRLGLRSSPDTHPSNNIILKINQGEQIKIIGNPVCNYGWLLWYVQASNGKKGWLPETDTKPEFFLEIVNAKYDDPTEIVASKPLRGLKYPVAGCEGSLLTEMSWALVVKASQENVIRSSRTMGSTTNILETTKPGMLLRLTGEKVCSDGRLLWRVISENNVKGWAPETDGTDSLLRPFDTRSVCAGAPNTILQVGDTAKIALDSPHVGYLRNQPTANATLLAELQLGETMKIVDGPKCAEGYVWWQVSARNGSLTGWTAEGDSDDHRHLVRAGE